MTTDKKDLEVTNSSPARAEPCNIRKTIKIWVAVRRRSNHNTYFIGFFEHEEHK